MPDLTTVAVVIGCSLYARLVIWLLIGGRKKE